MNQWESVNKFSKHSENFLKSYNIEFYIVSMASEGLVLILQCETIEKNPYLEVYLT